MNKLTSVNMNTFLIIDIKLTHKIHERETDSYIDKAEIFKILHLGSVLHTSLTQLAGFDW